MSLIAPHPFGHLITTTHLIEQFSALSNWESRYRQLLMLAKSLPLLTEQQKATAHPVKGCENRVWLGAQCLVDGQFHFYLDSDSRIVRGLLAVLLTSIEGKTAIQLLSNSPLAILEQLSLSQQLSASRIQGLQAFQQAVMQIAHQH